MTQRLEGWPELGGFASKLAIKIAYWDVDLDFLERHLKGRDDNTSESIIYLSREGRHVAEVLLLKVHNMATEIGMRLGQISMLEDALARQSEKQMPGFSQLRLRKGDLGSSGHGKLMRFQAVRDHLERLYKILDNLRKGYDHADLLLGSAVEELEDVDEYLQRAMDKEEQFLFVQKL